MRKGLTNNAAPRYADAFERIMEREAGDATVAVLILQELGKDRRMRAMRDSERRRSRSLDEVPATEKQIAFLESLGGEVTRG